MHAVVTRGHDFMSSLCSTMSLGDTSRCAHCALPELSEVTYGRETMHSLCNRKSLAAAIQCTRSAAKCHSLCAPKSLRAAGPYFPYPAGGHSGPQGNVLALRSEVARGRSLWTGYEGLCHPTPLVDALAMQSKATCLGLGMREVGRDWRHGVSPE